MRGRRRRRARRRRRSQKRTGSAAKANWQLWIVHGFSILNKLAHGFLSGDAIAALFGAGKSLAQLTAVGVIVAEALVPMLLSLGKERLGFYATALLHGKFALAMPGL